MTPYTNIGCRDCEEIAMVLLDHDVEVWTQDADTFTCPDGEERCAHCVCRMSHPEDYDRTPRNTWGWAGPSYTADEIITAMALADSGL